MTPVRLFGLVRSGRDPGGRHRRKDAEVLSVWPWRRGGPKPSGVPGGWEMLAQCQKLKIAYQLQGFEEVLVQFHEGRHVASLTANAVLKHQ